MSHSGLVRTRYEPNGSVPNNPVEQWIFPNRDETRDALEYAVNRKPVIREDTVFIGGNKGLYSLDRNTGDLNWTAKLSSGDNEWSASSSPVDSDDTIFIGGGATRWEPGFYAIDTSTGDHKWTYDIEKPVGGDPAVVNDTVVFATEESAIHAVDATTGEVEWTFTVDAAGVFGSSAPAIENGTVYIGTTAEDKTLYAIELDTGDVKWSVELPDSIWSTAAVSHGKVFLSCHDKNVYAFDAETGEQAWVFETRGFGRGSSDEGVAVTEDTVFVGSHHTLYAIDATTGDQLWSHSTEGKIGPAPVVVADTVLLGTREYDEDYRGRIIAIDIANKTQKWSLDFHEPKKDYQDATAPLITPGHGMLFITERGNGRITALG